MPRLKKERSPYEAWVGMVLVRKKAEDKTFDELAAAVGLSRQALCRRLAKPETVTLELFRKINRALAIPAEDARKALPMW